MKPIFLSMALVPLLLTGCVTSGGYYSDYPGYYDPGYYVGPDVGIAFYNGGGYYHHNYHHTDQNWHHDSTAYHGTYHSSTRVASSGSVHAFHGSSHNASASVSAGHWHH